MKKIILALVVLIPILAFTLGDKDTLDFKIYIKPGYTYITHHKSISHLELRYIGDLDFYQTLKDKGIPNPTIKEDTSVRRTVMNSYDMGRSGKFPIVMIIGNTFKELGQPTDNIVIYGNCKLEKEPTIDSVSAPFLTDEIRKELLKEFQKTFAQLILPEKNLKVGEDFTIVQPLKMPFGKTVSDIDLTTNYKLLSVSGDSAVFATTESYKMKLVVDKDAVKIDGHGAGKLYYDIKNNYYQSYYTNDTMRFSQKYTDFTLDAKNVIGMYIQDSVIKR